MREQKAWTVSEEAALVVLADVGAPLLAVIFGRSPMCIRRKASRLGISVKKISRITVTELSQVALEHVRRLNTEALCPHCSKRLVAIETSGLCGVCHKNVLIEAHNERLAELEAQREINRLKKAQQRVRDELGIVPTRSRRKTSEAADVDASTAPEQGGRAKARTSDDTEEVTPAS